MKIFIDFDENNKVIAFAYTRGSQTEIEFELDEMHPIFTENPFYFKLVDGNLIKEEGMQERLKQERKNRREIFELKDFLKESDFYFIRKMDEGSEIPADIKQKRQQARKRLKELGL